MTGMTAPELVEGQQHPSLVRNDILARVPAEGMAEVDHDGVGFFPCPADQDMFQAQ